jgi:hypothetical protein
MRKAESRLQKLPTVLTHGDFNPHNIMEGGVIDWERTTYAPAGHDLASNMCNIFFFPSSGDFEFTGSYTFSKEQILTYWQKMDEIYLSYKLPKISEYANDFIFCRSMWAVVGMHKYPKLQQWRYVQYPKLLEAYLHDEDLTDFLLNYSE